MFPEPRDVINESVLLDKSDALPDTLNSYSLLSVDQLYQKYSTVSVEFSASNGVALHSMSWLSVGEAGRKVGVFIVGIVFSIQN